MAKSNMELEQELYGRLTEAFPDNAYNVDRSRGFPLIGIRGAFIIGRLNMVFGLLGTGWRYAHSPFVEYGKEFVTEVVIQYRVGGDAGVLPYGWNTVVDSFVPIEDGIPIWSEPVYGVGGNPKGSGGVPVSDAQKSAISNALGKAASRLGVGVDAYKGNLIASDDGVSVKGDSDTTPADEAEFIKFVMKEILVGNPDMYDELSGKHKVAAAHKRALVSRIKAAVKSAGLEEFVTENLQAIVGDKDVKSVENLSAGQLLLLNSVAKSISVEEVTWKQALEITGSLGEKTWDEALGEYMAKLAKVKEDGS